MKIFMKLCIVLVISIAVYGCGKSNSGAPAAIDPSTGKHASGWLDVGTGGLHPSSYFADPNSCKGCHGDNLDGGITKVSCSPGQNSSGCHEKFPHQVGFSNPTVHGASAKGQATPNGIFGMAHCQKCHGLDYTGGVGPSCIKCHQSVNPGTNAPHAGNWAKTFGKHSKSDESNASACNQCHAGGKYSKPPSSPASGGTTPGCFNGTLCHNNVSAHQKPFISASDHGKAIKETNDWSYCGNCHAVTLPGDYIRFNNNLGDMVYGCETCHKKPYLAHPQMWLQGRGTGTPTTIGGSDTVKNTSHIDVPASKIITSCTLCHGITVPSANLVVPSCATATGKSNSGMLCHFTSPVDSTGQSNGCKSCHKFSSTDFSNFSTNKHDKHNKTISSNWPGLSPSCYACHNPLGRGATHADGKVDVAVLPQFGLSAAYSLATKTCSGVSCHGGTTPAWTSASIGCPACHTTPPSGSSFPNTANAHAKHAFSCEACHSGAGSGTAQHASGARQAAVVAFLPSIAGGAIYNSSDKICSNVACHGGSTTPPWSAAGIGCSACHTTPPSGTSFPNTANAHAKHAFNCDVCHNGAGSGTAQHASGSRQSAVVSFLQAVAGSATYNSTAKTCSNVTCHGAAGSTPPWTSVGGGCTTCHGGPPWGPNGTSFPNTANAHAKHTTLAGVTCPTCHNGAGSGTSLHGNGVVNIIFSTQAEVATATYNSSTKKCSSTTCHGTGNTTPAWSTTNANLGCSTCHNAPPSSNGHSKHWTAIRAVTNDNPQNTDMPCEICHTGDGPAASLPHPNGAVVVGIPAKFTEGGAASYTSGKCSNVSCHGQFQFNTQPWTDTTAVIDVNDQTTCLSMYCHKVTNANSASIVGTPVPYIGPFSGKVPFRFPDRGNLHAYHFNMPMLCTECHTLTYHFNSLTQGRRLLSRGFAARTITGTSITSYDPVTSTCVGVSGCHTEARTWY